METAQATVATPYDQPAHNLALSMDQARALNWFVKHFITAKTTGSLAKATYASAFVRKVEIAMTPQQFAVLQMVAIKQHDLAQLSSKTGRSVEDLRGLFTASTEIVRSIHSSEQVFS